MAFVFSRNCAAQTSPTQDAVAVWNAVNLAPFDSGKMAQVENLSLTRDRIHFTLVEGTLQFTMPAEGAGPS